VEESEKHMKKISRRDFIKTSVGGMLAVSALRCGGKTSGPRPKNLLIIMTDQQPVSTMGCYGNPLNPTPNLDRLAASGLRFDNCYISAFPCSPSRATLLTGRYPQGHGVYTNNVILSDDIPSLGPIMLGKGIETCYFGKSHLKGHMYRHEPGRKPFDGAWHNRVSREDWKFRLEKLEGGVGEDRPQLGFSRWVGGWAQYHEYLREAGMGHLLEKPPWPGNHNDLPSAPYHEHRYSLIPEEFHTASFLAGEAEDYLRGRGSAGGPFAMVLSLYGPHLPVSPPRPWDEKYGIEDCPLPDNHYDELEGKPRRQRDNTYCYVLPRWREAQFRDYIRRYYGYTAYIDGQIGRVLQALQESGLEEETIVLFTSDHGDMISAHGFVFKMEPCGYQELARVPLILRAPGITRPGTASGSLVSSVDIMPTLAELMDFELPGAQGRSFLSLPAKPGGSFRDRIFIHWGIGAYVTFDGRWKYGFYPEDEVDELYDLDTDPGEMVNLAAKPEFAPVLKEQLEAVLSWLAETGHPLAGALRSRKHGRASGP
jgi:arylsulfatase A-like enzyme